MTQSKDQARAQELLSIDFPAHSAPVQGLEPADPATEDAFKKAAHKLGEFLKSKGVEVGHGVALEALSASLGAKNWRAFRAKLAKAEKSVPKPFDGPRYLVNAIYTDNEQLYGDHVDADSPLQAAIYVQLERLMECGNATAVRVTDVVDRLTKDVVLSYDYWGELDLFSMSEAIRRVCALARKTLGEPPKRGVQEAEEWDAKHMAIDFWETALKVTVVQGEYAPLREETGFGDECNEIIEDPKFEESYGPLSAEPFVTFETYQGTEIEVNPAKALRTVCELAYSQVAGASQDNANENGLFAYLQVVEALAMHEKRFEHYLNGQVVRQAD